jgi:hypothetical protein
MVRHAVWLVAAGLLLLPACTGSQGDATDASQVELKTVVLDLPGMH